MFCLLVWGFSSHSKFFHSYGDVTMTGEGLQIFTYGRQIWPMSSVCSLACHTHSDMGHPFIMIISEDPWHSHQLPSVWQWNCHYLFLRLRSVADGIRTPNLPHARRTTALPLRPIYVYFTLNHKEQHIYKISHSFFLFGLSHSQYMYSREFIHID